jgi:hypothetical protein
MTDRDTTGKPTPSSTAIDDLLKSIFPTFNVNVPMPRDTAVPGSYGKPAQQGSSGVADAHRIKE